MKLFILEIINLINDTNFENRKIYKKNNLSIVL